MIYKAFQTNSNHSVNQVSSANTYTQQAIRLYENGAYEQAIPLLEDAGKIYQQNNKWANYIETYNNIGRNYALLTQFELAIAYFNIAFREGKKKIGGSHSEVSRACGYLGACYLYSNRYDKAVHYLRYALKNWSQQPVLYRREMASCHHYLGLVFFKQKQYSEALRYYQKALSKQLNNQVDPITAQAYISIGKTYFKKRAYQKAIAYLQKGLSIQLKVLGVQAMDTAKSYHALGTCYAHTNDLTRAEAYQSKAQSIWSTLYQSQQQTLLYTTQPNFHF